jgi:hypothetical protein
MEDDMTFDRTEAQMRAQAEMDRRQAEEQEACRELCEWVGLPLICPERGCRRAGRCAGPASAATFGMPPCFMHYREEVRFLLIGPENLAAELESLGLVSDEPVAREDGKSLIEFVYGRDAAALERLRRLKGVMGPQGWECDPEAFTR